MSYSKDYNYPGKGITEEEYHKNTPKYMVSERGKMPYDYRLVEDSRVSDDNNNKMIWDSTKQKMIWEPNKRDQIKFVEIYHMPSDETLISYEVERLDHEWQKKWFKENGDLNIRIKTRKIDGSNDETILTQIQKYKEDLGNFHKSDEYRRASEGMMKKDTDRSQLLKKRSNIQKALKDKTLRSISLEDANELGWIIENDPKYKIHSSSKNNAQYVYPNEFEKNIFTKENVILSDKPVWLGKTIIDEKKTKNGGKLYKSKKSKKMKKSRKTKKNKKTKKYHKSKRNHK